MGGCVCVFDGSGRKITCASGIIWGDRFLPWGLVGGAFELRWRWGVLELPVGGRGTGQPPWGAVWGWGGGEPGRADPAPGIWEGGLGRSRQPGPGGIQRAVRGPRAGPACTPLGGSRPARSLSRTLSGRPGREIRAHTDPQASDPLLSSLLHLLPLACPAPHGVFVQNLKTYSVPGTYPGTGPPIPPPGAEEAPGPRGPDVISLLLGSLGGPSWWGGSHPRGAGWGGGRGGHRPPQEVRKAGAHGSEDVDGQVSQGWHPGWSEQ